MRNGESRGAILYSANGIRTRVWALRGPRPSPLDDSAAAKRFVLQARRESNPQPPVLETGALPIELRTYQLQTANYFGLLLTADNCSPGSNSRFVHWRGG